MLNNILRQLNKDRVRCILIGRSALNLSANLAQGITNIGAGLPENFETFDYDVLCKNFKDADEIRQILEKSNFKKTGATLKRDSDKVEIDVLIADATLGECEMNGYFNFPSLSVLFENEMSFDGIYYASADSLIMNRLLYTRDNQGRDIETISIYLELYPEKIDVFIEGIKNIEDKDSRDKSLFSLYYATSKCSDKNMHKKVEKIMVDDIKTNFSIHK